jgi:hypothetical protein
MADLTVVEMSKVVCESLKCHGRVTRHHCMEVSVRGKATERHWLCTECYAKTPAPMPVTKEATA